MESKINSGKRDIKIDMIKGLLIVSVVVGHYDTSVLHDIIFLFHMPIFFIVSGFLLKESNIVVDANQYIRDKIRCLMLPYFIYLILSMLFIERNCSAKSWIKALWGGRALSGVYWYITCFLFTLILLSFILRHFSNRLSRIVILICGIAAVLESNIVDKVKILQSPGIPWNLDVSLMAIVYVGIGYFHKNKIRSLLEMDSKKLDFLAWITTLALTLFCWFIYKDGRRWYYFDMKPVYYKELLSAVLISTAFGFVLVRIVYWMNKTYYMKIMNQFFALCGEATIPIMFMHVPLNHWREVLCYGRSTYVVIGVAVPLVFTLLFNKNSLMRKLFGLPILCR